MKRVTIKSENIDLMPIDDTNEEMGIEEDDGIITSGGDAVKQVERMIKSKGHDIEEIRSLGGGVVEVGLKNPAILSNEDLNHFLKNGLTVLDMSGKDIELKFNLE